MRWEMLPILSKNTARVTQRLTQLSADQKLSESDRPRWLGYLKQLQTPQTSNYVIFDPNLIRIDKKYVVPGAVAGGMGALAAHDNYQPRGGL